MLKHRFFRLFEDLGLGTPQRPEPGDRRQLRHPPSLSAFIHQRIMAQAPDMPADKALALLEASRGQLHQDLFVLAETGFKREGFFVEFGATNGVDLSNSYLLETAFGWQGILAEPARVWHADLKANRAARIDTDCVWKTTGETLTFIQADGAEFSTLSAFRNADGHAGIRQSGQRYPVTTVSLMDLLGRHNAPRQIDYLSIDTEGSEFDILSAFDFDAYDISVITCEHNYTPMRRKLHSLLTARGYIRKYHAISQFDDWYVKIR